MTIEQEMAEMCELLAANRRLRLLLAEMRALRAEPLDGLDRAALEAHRERLYAIQLAIAEPGAVRH